MKIAMIGTRGVPARYGGFETAVEEIGRRLAERGHAVTVFCRGTTAPLHEYRGMRLVHLPVVRRRTLETLSHTALSVLHHQALRADAAVVFNSANAPLLPVLRAARVPVAVHVDGLEWQRSKWSKAGRRYYLASERLSVRWADSLIADAIGIQDYYRRRYATSSVYIPYGASVPAAPRLDRLVEVGLRERGYHLVVARFEPENNVTSALAAYNASPAKLPLVVIGGAPYAAEYSRELAALAAGNARIKMLGPLWDQELLDALYAGALTYVHGHSVGGTNPSLLRAMGAAAPVVAFDVVFNREVLGSTGAFWRDGSELAGLLGEAEADPASAVRRGLRGQQEAAARYDWEDVTDRYEGLVCSLVRR